LRLALLCLGMIMVQSAAMNVTGKTTWQWNPLGLKQLGSASSGSRFFVVGQQITHGSRGRGESV
jgi:hypothetical protein